MEQNTKIIPLLHDCSGPIYNPRKALMLFDHLIAGENKTAELLQDDRLIRTIRRALVARYPQSPISRKGSTGKSSIAITVKIAGLVSPRLLITTARVVGKP